MISVAPHPHDGRYTLLELSAKAAQDAPAALTEYHAAIQNLVAKTPPEQRAAIARFLQSAADAADAAVQKLR